MNTEEWGLLDLLTVASFGMQYRSAKQSTVTGARKNTQLQTICNHLETIARCLEQQKGDNIMHDTVKEVREYVDKHVGEKLKGDISIDEAMKMGEMCRNAEALERHAKKTKMAKPEEADEKEEAGEDEEEHANPYHEDIEDELEGSKHYYDMWLKTKRPEYKEMSLSELSHAENLVKFAREDNAISDEELAEVKMQHGAMLARLS